MYSPKQRLVSEKFVLRDVQSKKTKKNEDYYILDLMGKDGHINGMVWSDKLAMCEPLKIGAVIAVDGLVQEYRGSVNLVVESSRNTNEAAASILPQERTMVFDIECVGKKFDSLEPEEQEYMLTKLERNEPDEEVAKQKTGLYYLFGQVCSIGIYCPETKTGKVLAWSDRELIPEKPEYEYFSYPDEASLLAAFWKEVENYTRYAGYNNDGFDWPYLVLRSGINKVRVSMPIRQHDSEKWIDLQKIYKQNGAFKLEMICRAFGVENPKEEGVSGLHVQELFYEQNYQTIADYVARDAYSTALLYDIYRQYLKGIYL